MKVQNPLIYVQGYWVPVLTFGGASVGITYGTQIGTYTKIGKLVMLNCDIVLSSKGSSVGSASITGIPTAITPGGTPPEITSAVGLIHGGTYGGPPATPLAIPIARLDASSNTVYLVDYLMATGVSQNIADTNFSNTTQCGFTIVYNTT